MPSILYWSRGGLKRDEIFGDEFTMYMEDLDNFGACAPFPAILTSFRPDFTPAKHNLAQTDKQTSSSRQTNKHWRTCKCHLHVAPRSINGDNELVVE